MKATPYLLHQKVGEILKGILIYSFEGSLSWQKSKCPIIPVSINNADRIFEKQFPWIKSTDVVIEYGEPIYIDNLEEGEKAYLGKYKNIIWNMLKKITRLHNKMVQYYNCRVLYFPMI